MADQSSANFTQMLIGLEGQVLGQGTLHGMVTNSGTMQPQGQLTVEGPYTQTQSGALSVELGGVTSGLAVHGKTSLNGTLIITLAANYVPHAGDSFVIMTGTQAINGTFATLELPG